MNSVKANQFVVMGPGNAAHLNGSARKYNKVQQRIFSKVGKTFFILKGAVDVTEFRVYNQLPWVNGKRPEYEFKGEWQDCAKYLKDNKKIIIYP